MYLQVNPKKIESKNIFKHSLFIGIAILLYLALALIITFALEFAIYYFKGFSSDQITNLLLHDNIVAYSFNSVLSVIALTLPFILIAKILKYKVADIGSFEFPTNKKHVPSCIIFALGFIIIGNIISAIVYDLCNNLFNAVPVQPELGSSTYNSAFEFFFVLFCTAVVPALAEEFAFRGIVLGSLRKFGDWPAIIFSAVLFSFLHGNFAQIPFTFVLGISLGMITVMTNSIWPAVFVHFLNNSFAVYADAGKLSENVIAYIYLTIVIISILAFILLLFNKAFKEIKNVPSCFSSGKRTLKLFLSPTVIICFIIFIIEAVYYFVAA